MVWIGLTDLPNFRRAHAPPPLATPLLLYDIMTFMYVFVHFYSTKVEFKKILNFHKNFVVGFSSAQTCWFFSNFHFLNGKGYSMICVFLKKGDRNSTLMSTTMIKANFKATMRFRQIFVAFHRKHWTLPLNFLIVAIGWTGLKSGDFGPLKAS